MKVEPGIYPLNGADENSVCLTTVDFALTYFLVSGELERSGVPCNLVINDAGGLSVLTAWAAGKLSSYFHREIHRRECRRQESRSRKLIIPGKVAVSQRRYRGETSGMGSNRSSAGGCTACQIPERYAGERPALIKMK
ncbi:MAG: hypothetical protein ACLRPV_15980 [Lacrimispora saccharolytica]